MPRNMYDEINDELFSFTIDHIVNVLEKDELARKLDEPILHVEPDEPNTSLNEAPLLPTIPLPRLYVQTITGYSIRPMIPITETIKYTPAIIEYLEKYCSHLDESSDYDSMPGLAPDSDDSDDDSVPDLV